jgi:outer membrane protein assembly factor BamE (lipoprotein component of BamABCDE complex)
MVNASPSPARPAAATEVRDSRARRPLRGALAATLLLLGGCSWFAEMPPLPGADLFDSPRQLRGHLIEDDELRQVVAGVSSRADVQALLGSPSTTGTFEESDWFYIGGVTRQRPGRLLGIEDQQVVVISFDPRGTVREVRRLGPEDGRTIVAVARATPSPGTERSFMQQLFGNIGRVGPGLGGAQQTGPGAPSSTGPR